MEPHHGGSLCQSLNDAVKQGKSTELLLIAEALQEKKITRIADEIAARNQVKMVLLSGPRLRENNHL